MNDEQCQIIVDALKLIASAVSFGSEKIADSIDGIYSSDNGGIERRLDALIDTMLDIEERRRLYASE